MISGLNSSLEKNSKPSLAGRLVCVVNALDAWQQVYGANPQYAGQRLRLEREFTESVHVVRAGENLSSIAASYGMRLSTLRELNAIRPGESRIVPGQRLRVEPQLHVVRSGDTLLEIALSHGVSLSALLAANRLSESSIIRPGQRIRIPGRG